MDIQLIFNAVKQPSKSPSIPDNVTTIFSSNSCKTNLHARVANRRVEDKHELHGQSRASKLLVRTKSPYLFKTAADVPDVRSPTVGKTRCWNSEKSRVHSCVLGMPLLAGGGGGGGHIFRHSLRVLEEPEHWVVQAGGLAGVIYRGFLKRCYYFNSRACLALQRCTRAVSYD